ncbi:MAG: hypothetical protein HeimC2_02080 [Candidatus Heimdallarchaeota archaeon LC_2]|nr:MAG: hypothetical protein HeimC2_02080 [Candidatus Heimdallarchaeota archaeon LC_2]
MEYPLSTKRKLLISLSELIGLIISIIPTIWVIINGGVIEDTFIDIAFSSLKLALVLRSVHEIFVFLTLVIIIFPTLFLFIVIRKKISHTGVNFTSNRWFYFRVFIGVYIGYIIGRILFYVLLNSIFYRNAFVTIPFLLGSALFIGVLGLIFGNPELTPRVIDLLNPSEVENPIKISKLRFIGVLSKVTFFLIIAFLLIIPNIIPLIGTLPTPPEEPEEPYLSNAEIFDFEVIKLEHIIPTNISEKIEPENSDGKWYIYIYLPKIESQSNLQFPVALYIHGFSGIDIKLYHSSMKTLAQRGIISIFTQYATFINLQGDEANVKYDHLSGNPELYVRYAMEWSGISQTVKALNLETNSIGSQTLLNVLGSNYTIDYSRLMIIGHSMGGGMIPYITSKILEMGWGSNELILDMEAPWYASTWIGYEPNYQIIPSHTLLNIATYEDDHQVSQCIGMNFYEQIRLSNGTQISDEQLSFIYISSDFHGFPRLLASHYLPIDPLDDSLHQYGYKKRIKAMAFYLFESAQGRIDQMNEVFDYFLGNKVENMGDWSDGESVNEAYSTNDPYGIRGEVSLVDQIQDSSDDLCVSPINR